MPRAIIREIGVETGGINIQFAVNPENGRMIVIEMNPRVCVRPRWHQRPRVPHREDRRQARRGLHARRDPNDITRKTPACFEPTIDYVVKDPALGFREVPRAIRRR